jgi:hypothetical protein
MIAYLPQIKEHELLYSWLARAYAHSGLSAEQFSKEIIQKSSAYLDYKFWNQYYPEFKEVLLSQLSIEDLIINHTMFKNFARFLPLEQRLTAWNHALELKPNVRQHLSIPLRDSIYHLRFCEKCVCKDQMIGEIYFRTVHQIRELVVCPLCGVGLEDTNLVDHKGRQNVFKSLEQLNPLGLAKRLYTKDDINRRVAKYVYQVDELPIEFNNNVLIGDYLTSRLEGTKYISRRGQQRNLDILFSDISTFYQELEYFTLTKRRLAAILLNQSFNNYEICLICYFLKIEPTALTQPTLPQNSITVRFDTQLREFHNQGFTNNQIALKMGVDHEAVRQILKGTYNLTHKSGPRYIPQKWPWKRIDREISKKLVNAIRNLKDKGIKINKRNLSIELGLKDFSWRNLPLTKEVYKNVKNVSE